jgi:hypothetical protein
MQKLDVLNVQRVHTTLSHQPARERRWQLGIDPHA